MDSEKKTVVLEIEGQSVECDKSVLISNSDYFSAMFKGNFRESLQENIKIEGVDLKAFNVILLLLWDETYSIDLNLIHLVLQAACMLQFNTIKTICEKSIVERLNASISLRIWKMTEMLDIVPLCFKAKNMALEEFSFILHTNSLLELSLDEICIYLSHINLNTITEMLVFQAAMNWFSTNKNQYPNINSDTILLKLLSCLDMKNCTQNDIKEMQAYKDIKDNSYILEILDMVIKINAGEPLPDCGTQQSLVIAKHLCNSKSRKEPIVPCLLLESDNSKQGAKSVVGKNVVVIYDNFGRRRRLLDVFSTVKEMPSNNDISVLLYDRITNNFQEFFGISRTKLKDLAGFKLLSYKESVLLFGGEYMIGAGRWSENIWSFNTFKESWSKITTTYYTRRHFEAIILDGRLYIVGGIGRFRIAQNTLTWYNIEKNRWSSDKPLPTSSWQYKCCTFGGKLYLVYVTDAKAYVFKQQRSWDTIDIIVSQDILNSIGPYAVFTDSEYFYIKGKTLLKLKLMGKQLILESQHEINNIEYEEIDCILCDRSVYSFYKSMNEGCDLVYIFEELNLDTLISTEIFRKVSNTTDPIQIDGKSFYFSSYTKLFTVRYYAEEDEFINTCL